MPPRLLLIPDLLIYCLPASVHLMAGELPGQVDAVGEAEDEQADAGAAFHAEHRAFGVFFVAQRDGPTQAEKPEAHSARDARQAEQLALERWLDPAAGNEVGP